MTVAVAVAYISDHNPIGHAESVVYYRTLGAILLLLLMCTIDTILVPMYTALSHF